MNKLHFITTTKYGQVVVSNNKELLIVKDEEGNEVDRFPAGLVIRWIPKGKYEPSIEFVEGVFTSDFKSDAEIREYIDNNITLK